jgi:hypothetical protein
MVDLRGVLFIIFLAVLVYYIRSGMPSGQQGGQSHRSLSSNQMIYQRLYNEFDDYNNVLKRPVYPADATTNDLVGFMWGEPVDSQPARLFTPPANPLNLTKGAYVTPAKPSPDLKQRVKARQPYFMGKPYVKNYYGKRYYADWRYPLFLVSTDFAENPAKFIQDHPLDYPSYIINARTPMPCDTGEETLGPYESYEPVAPPGYMSVNMNEFVNVPDAALRG